MKLESLEDNVQYVVTEAASSLKVPANNLVILIDLDVSLGQTENSIGKKRPQEAVARTAWTKLGDHGKLNLYFVRPMDVEELEPGAKSRMESISMKNSKAKRKANAIKEIDAEDKSNNDAALIAMIVDAVKAAKA